MTKIISPELLYECPLMKEYFGNPKEYCKECVYLQGFRKNGYGEDFWFDETLCNHDSSVQKVNQDE